MILPTVYGKLNQSDFFIFSACDTHYFNDFGKSLVNSILKNTNQGVHLHIFNPKDEDIRFCEKDPRISTSYEYVSREDFVAAAERWCSLPCTEPEKTRYLRTVTAMEKGKDQDMLERVQKTYYACARFIRLENLTKENDKFFAMDVDAVVRQPILELPKGKDCYLYRITGKKARILAGGMFTDGNTNGRKFLKEYSKALSNQISNDYIYWSMDQDLLDPISPNFDIGDLPLSLIDWEMHADSAVWTAKGTRKDQEIFVNEKMKYISL